MKLKYRFEYVDTDSEIVAVPVGNAADEIRGILKLNTEGREILELLANDTTTDEVIDTLSNTYETDRAILASYVNDVVKRLQSINLLVD